MIKITEPTHLVVLFDGEHDNPRAELSAENKANRPSFADVPDEDNPFSQLTNIIIAGPSRTSKTTLAKKISEELNCFIISLDKLVATFQGAYPQLDMTLN